MPKSDSGFNEEQFRKLVAMFDTPYRNEAIVAFNKALDELAKDQRRFCDRLVDATESKTAKAECKRVRTELAGAFEKLAKREAEARQLEETISRLHQQIATIEEAHKASAAEEPEAEFDPVPDYDWPDEESAAPFEAQTEKHSTPEPQNLGFDFTAIPVAEPVFSTLEPAPSLPFGVAVFWLSLVVLSLLVTLWGITVRRPLTDDDWRNTGSLILLLTPFCVGGLYLWGRRKGFAAGSFGELCVAYLDGPKAMFTGLYVALWAYYLISLFLLDGRDDVSAYRHIFALGIVIALVFVGLLLTREIRSFGVKGFLLHVCMFIDVAAVAFSLMLQRGPWTFAQLPYPAPSVDPFLVVLVSSVLLYFAWSERVTTWFLEDDETEYDEHDKPIKRTERAEWITVPAVIILILIFFGGNDFRGANGSGRSHRQRPAPAPSPSVLTQQAPGLLLANKNFETAATVDQDQPAEWKVWCCVVGSSLVGLRIVAWRLQKARLRKAWKEGNTYRPSNVHGAAGYAKAKRARKAGWI